MVRNLKFIVGKNSYKYQVRSIKYKVLSLSDILFVIRSTKYFLNL
ncbi:hypothetical protein I600_3056 [Maribacter dokdonensis DSW-8]|nr:hypothetical protein I600_3056 [Maribacter dokdonensis DSW-8]